MHRLIACVLPRHGLYLTILTAALGLSGLGGSGAEAQSLPKFDSPAALLHAIAPVPLGEPPPARVPAAPPATSDLTGVWTGRLTHAGDGTGFVWDEELDLKQDSTNAVTGTRKTVAESDPTVYAVWTVTGTFANGTFTYTDDTLVTGTPNIHFCQTTGALPLDATGTILKGNWQSPGCGGGTIDVTKTGSAPALKLLRQDLTHVLANGTPQKGVFSYTFKAIAGTVKPAFDYAAGMTKTTNPNVIHLTDPPNTVLHRPPTPGSLASVTAKFTVGARSASKSFKIASFGLSCYYTALEQDFGTAPKACKSTTFKLKSWPSPRTFSGFTTNPPGLTGSYCNSFLAQVRYLQGSGTLRTGGHIQFLSGIYKRISVINSSDGTPVVANRTVARARSIIPAKGVTIDIDQIGTGLLANDVGSDIKGYRLDLYRGSGIAVCSGFNNPIAISACSPASSSCPGSAIP